MRELVYLTCSLRTGLARSALLTPESLAPDRIDVAYNTHWPRYPFPSALCWRVSLLTIKIRAPAVTQVTRHTEKAAMRSQDWTRVNVGEVYDQAITDLGLRIAQAVETNYAETPAAICCQVVAHFIWTR